jgi:hypothetical protein
MFRPFSSHHQVHNWSLKQIEEEIYVYIYLPEYILKTNCEPEDYLR